MLCLFFINNLPVGLERVTLSKFSMADVALVRLLSRMNSQMTLQLERVRTCVGAMRTLKRALTRVTSEIMFKRNQQNAYLVFIRMYACMLFRLNSSMSYIKTIFYSR